MPVKRTFFTDVIVIY